jgi:uncharacterized protein YerC
MQKLSIQGQRQLAIDTLRKSAARMSGKRAVTKFVEDLMTEDEMVTIGRRLLIAQMILSGKTQAEIRYLLGVSPNTFTRMRKWLEREIPEYGKAIKDHKKRQKERDDRRRKKVYDRPQPFSLADLQRRYPMHFLLFNVAEELLRQK